MGALRCTTRLLELLGDPMTEERPASPDDWYANVFWVQRRKCLLVTHAETLFSVFAPAVRAASLRPLDAFVALITRQLAAEGFPAAVLGPLDCGRASIARTADRQVLGCMNVIAGACEHAAADAGGLARLDLTALHYRLQPNITSARDYVPAIDVVANRPSKPAGRTTVRRKGSVYRTRRSRESRAVRTNEYAPSHQEKPGNLSDPADPRGDVGRLGERTAAQKRLEEAWRLVDPKLDVADLATLEPDYIAPSPRTHAR